MNCGDFDQRMQRLIDDRIPLATDDLLSAHACWCDDCREQMQVWEQIETVVPVGIQTPNGDVVIAPAVQMHDRGISVGWSMFTAIAAVFLIAYLIGYSKQGQQVTVVANNMPVTVDEEFEVDPASWWRDVQDRDWIGETMPAMLKQALAILTTGGGEKTS